MTVSLKVPVAQLIASAKEKRQAEVDAYEVSLAEYHKALPKWRGQVVKLLQQAVKDLQSGVDVDSVATRDRVYRNGEHKQTLQVEVGLDGDAPEKPSEPRLGRYDRDIRLLEATSQTDVLVKSGSDFERYI